MPAVIIIRDARKSGNSNRQAEVDNGVGEAGGGGHGRETASRDFIEERNARGLVDRASVLASFHADLDLLARSDALVGTASSWSTRAALLAVVGEQGTVPPFAMLDRPLNQLWFA